MPLPRCDILLLPAEGLRRRFILSIPAEGFEAAVREKLEALRTSLAPVSPTPASPTPANLVPAAAAPELPSPEDTARRFGRGVRDGLARDIANEAAAQLIRRDALRPAEPPRFDPLAPGPAGEVRVAVSFEVMPRVTPPDLAGITLPEEAAEPGATEVDHACAALGLSRGRGEDAPPGHVAAAGEVALVRIRARRLTMAPDLLPNPRAEGASVTDGRPPRGWGLAWRKEGIAAVVGQNEEDGRPSLDIRVNGVVSPRVTPTVAFGWAGGAALLPPLRVGEEVVLAGRWRLLAGALPPGMRASALIEEGDASEKVLARAAGDVAAPQLAPLAGQLFTARFTVTQADTVALRPALRLRPTTECEASFILRLSGVRLMRLPAASDTGAGAGTAPGIVAMMAAGATAGVAVETAAGTAAGAVAGAVPGAVALAAAGTAPGAPVGAVSGTAPAASPGATPAAPPEAISEAEALPALEHDLLALPVGGADAPGLPPGLAARLGGCRVGDTLVHDLALPFATLPGPGEARLHVTVQRLLQPPKVDEALAAHLGERDLAALRARVAAALRERRRDAAALRRRRALVDAILARSDVLAPQILVDQVQAPRQATLRERIAAGRLSQEEHAAGMDALLAALRRDCERAVRAELLLNALRRPGEPAPDPASAVPEQRHQLLLDRLIAGLAPAGTPAERSAPRAEAVPAGAAEGAPGAAR
ncbi:trigger factor [Roseomonas elaeocarpi]|uniref:Trigger factor n=1 Tax=Roseomonas elaeocarpi TaxID=907779 RepID=A0ABV6JS84_9PROT